MGRGRVRVEWGVVDRMRGKMGGKKKKEYRKEEQ